MVSEIMQICEQWKAIQRNECSLRMNGYGGMHGYDGMHVMQNKL